MPPTPGRRRPITYRRRRLLLGAGLLALAAIVVVLAGGDSHRQRHGAATARAPTASVPPRGPSSSAAASPKHTTGYPESETVRRLIALGRPIYCAPALGHEVALTFDDGPGPYTRLMLAKLRKHHAAATFFIVGRNIPLDPKITRAERALGAVGDHTFTHPLLTTLPASLATSEILDTKRALERSSGGNVFLFRPPYGAHNPAIDSIARAHGLLEVLWNVDSADSLGAGYTQIERTVIAGLRPGSIILMHENHGQTIRAMLAIFAAIARKQPRAVSVPQLLSDDPPSAAQVLAGGSDCGLGRAKGPTGG